MKYLELIIAMLLLLCLTSMPYGYYELVRYLTSVLFIWKAFQSLKIKNERDIFLFVSIAILFQPFVKITLSKTIWGIIDIVVAILLIFTYVKNIRENK